MAVGDLWRLTPQETPALEALRAAGALRIGQERLDWDRVLARL
ncbi:MAG: hypothetical protein ACTHMH_10435 [Curtobacterium sp.]